MKKLLLSLTLIISSSTFAIEGVVTAFKAPLFKSEDIRSKVYQYVDKGSSLYINNKHIDIAYLTNYRADQDTEAKAETEETEFYTTSDGIGRTAYILRKHVKLVYNDLRELESKVITNRDTDDTDYRIDEPIPENYPFNSPINKRSVVKFSYDSAPNVSYPYPTKVRKANMGPRYRLAGEFSKKADFDKLDRIYYGLEFGFWFGFNDYILENNSETTETYYSYFAGPKITYDFYKTLNHLFTMGLGVRVAYNRLRVTQDSDDGYRDRQNYDALSYTPNLTGSYSIRNVFKNTDIQFGAELLLNLPYTYETALTKYEEELWSQTDEVEVPLTVNTGVNIAIVHKF